MKVLVYMGHPAHFHLLKNLVERLKRRDHQVVVTIQAKDILEDLLARSGLEYHNVLPEGRPDSKLGLALGMLKRDWRLLSLCRREKPQIMLGTSVELPHVGRLLGIPTVNLNEDDCDAVPLYCRLSYPLSQVILAPHGCSTGKWERKTIHYPGYHELAYLHPRVFKPDREVLKGRLPLDRPYFLLRFSGLAAHHDSGKTGITAAVARRAIGLLKDRGRVFITSERPLEDEFEALRIPIDPMDMHHALYYADLYVGDSQTMAAEAAVLGTPSLRFNDFVGKLGYLEELEHRYGLTYGIKTDEPGKLYEKIEALATMKDRGETWQSRRRRMLSEKIDVTDFLLWFIENYQDCLKWLKKSFDNRGYVERYYEKKEDG